MPYVLGIDIGTGSTVVAVARLQRGGWGPPEVVTIPSTLPLDGDGPQVAHGFLRRIGDDVPMVLADRPYRAAALVAELVERIVESTAAAEGGPAEQVVVCVPGTWGPGRTEQSRAALDGRVALLAAPVAAAEAYAAREPLDVGHTVAVYDLGGTHCECALVARADTATFTVLECAETGTPFGGADLDDALVGWVRARLGPAADPDPAEPQGRLALATLRGSGTAAREELSTADTVTG